MLNQQKRLQSRINRILHAFTRDNEPDLIHFVSGVNAPSDSTIDDGSTHYGDPLATHTPDWVARDKIGWK